MTPSALATTVARADTSADGAARPPARVLFAVDGMALVPLACYDPVKHRLSGGTDCSRLIRVGATVAFDRGDTAQITSAGHLFCGGEVHSSPAFFIEPDRLEPTGPAATLAFWPPRPLLLALDETSSRRVWGRQVRVQFDRDDPSSVVLVNTKRSHGRSHWRVVANFADSAFLGSWGCGPW